MENEYLNLKLEIEKINHRVKEYLWNKWYSFKSRRE